MGDAGVRGHFLPVSEIFYSVQGEGLRTGEPSLFLRLSGCNINCWFCDTDKERFSLMTVPEILAALRTSNSDCDWVVLTGGEPLTHEPKVLKELLEALKVEGYKVQLETNGTLPTDLDFDHITVSPKEDQIHHNLNRSQIKEIKIIMQAGDRPTCYLADIPHFLQPIDWEGQTEENTDYCRNLVAAAPDKWRLSLQWQKIWGIR